MPLDSLTLATLATIDNQQAEIERLRAALTEIANWDPFFYPGHKDEIPKIAKAALADQQEVSKP